MKTKALLGRFLRTLARPWGYSIVGGTPGWIPLFFDPLLKPAGVRLLRTDQIGGSYIDCRSTVAKARQMKISVPDYVAKLWDEEGLITEFTSYLEKVIPLRDCSRILEIGAGTGRFLEPLLKIAQPKSYGVYETNLDWAEYLEETYNVTAYPADGQSLSHIPDASQDLVHAHQVFVYLPVRTSFHYFYEMSRVCAENGFVVFDAYLDNRHDLAAIDGWLRHPASYQVILPRSAIVELFTRRGFQLLDGGFQMKAYVGRTQYLVFRRSQVVE